MVKNNWRNFELGEIIEIKKDKYNPKKEHENYPCIELEHINQVTGTINGHTKSTEQSSIKNKFSKGDVLYGKLRPYLRKYYLCEFDGVCSSEIWVLNGKKVENEFLYYLIQDDIFNSIANVSTGSKMPRADWSFMEVYPFSIPQKLEQKKIVEILSTWDSAIEKQEQLIEKKKKFKKGLMQFLYSHGTIKEERIKTKIGEMPASWRAVKAKEVFNSVSIKDNEHEELLSVTQDRGTIPRTLLEGSVVMPEGSTKGYKLVVPKNFIISLRSFQGGLEISQYRGIVSPAYTVLENKIDIGNDYFKFFFKKESFISRLNGIIVGIRDGKQISYSDFGEIYLPLPSIEEQEKIAEILTLADKEIELLQKKLDALKLQKKGLMQSLLTGEIRVSL